MQPPSVWCATSATDGMGGIHCTDCDIAIALPSGASTEMEYGHASLIRWQQILADFID
jgi:hypothetical protein